ncbi:MAG: DMT family transporter [Alphaproteobacteria bacterium]|nr:DMT family transporter [Alphaproteobacteria bacterium]
MGLTRLPPVILLTLSALFWGGNFVVGRWAHTEIAPLSLTYWRWILAGAILLPFVAGPVWRDRALVLRHWRLLAILSMSGMAMFHSFTYIALSTTTAINAAVVLASMPMVIPVVSFLIGDERLGPRQSLGIAISLAGVGVIVSRGEWAVLAGLQFTPGDVWILAAVLAWSVYSVLLRRLPAEMPPMVMLGVCMWLAVGMLTPFYLWELGQVGPFAPTGPTLAALAYVAVFAGIVAFVCWNAAVPRVGANKAGLFIHLIPVFASIFSILFLGESLYAYHFAGIAPIVAGIYLTTTAKTRAD